MHVKLSTTPLSPVRCQTRDPERIVAPSESRQERGGVQMGAGDLLALVTVHAPFCAFRGIDQRSGQLARLVRREVDIAVDVD